MKRGNVFSPSNYLLLFLPLEQVARTRGINFLLLIHPLVLLVNKSKQQFHELCNDLLCSQLISSQKYFM
jgi:hypothetical protein